MAIFRVEKTRDFTVMSNYHLRDKTLSYKAKGLLSVMLSLPDTWDYTTTGLASLTNDGIDKVRSGLRELEAHGYVVRQRERKKNGTYCGSIYAVYEKPVPVADIEPEMDSPTLEEPALEKPMLENPILDNPSQEKPALENPTQLNTYQSNTKKLNTNLSNTQSINPDPMDGSDAEQYRQLVKENIEYDHLVRYRSVNQEQLDNVVEIIVDTLCSHRRMIRLGRADVEAEIVRSRLLKLNSEHIEYVLDSLKETTTDIQDIWSYILTALYRAPVTMDAHYTAKVNHDLAFSEIHPKYS